MYLDHLEPGRKLYEANRALMQEWVGDSGLPWSELTEAERVSWEEHAAQLEAQDREED